MSWRHPRSRHWHQLDLVITRRSSLNHVLITWSYHSADCDIYHSLVGSKVRLRPKKIHRAKQLRPTCASTRQRHMTLSCGTVVLSKEPLVTAQLALQRQGGITIYTSAMDVFGERDKINPDWFERVYPEAQCGFRAKRSTNDSLRMASTCTLEVTEAYSALRAFAQRPKYATYY